jgi:hypothetical protein
MAALQQFRSDGTNNSEKLMQFCVTLSKSGVTLLEMAHLNILTTLATQYQDRGYHLSYRSQSLKLFVPQLGLLSSFSSSTVSLMIYISSL